MSSAKKDKYMLIFILAVSVVLHFFNLKSLSLSNDELSAITRAKYDTFSEMIINGVYIDYHPAGIEAFIYFWIKLFGDNDFLLRLPFVFCAFGSTILLYLIAKKWYNEFVALLSIVAFTSCSLVLQYTQIARMYSTGILFCLIAAYGWTMFLFPDGEKRARKYWWYWLFGSILCIHNHYFSFAFAGVLGLSGLFFVKKEDVKSYLLGGLIPVFTFLPEMKIFLEQMKTGDIGGWLGAPEKTFILDFFYVVFNNSYLLIAITLAWIILGLVKPVKFDHVWRWRSLSVIWFLFVFLLAYLYSVLGHPVIQFSTLLFVLPFLFVFIFSFTPAILVKYKFPTVFLFLGIGIYTVIASGFYSKNHFGVFKEIAEDVNSFPQNAPVVVNVINTSYFDYYYSKIKTNDRKLLFKLEGPSDYGKLMGIVDTSKSNEFGYVWTNSFHPYEIPEIIRMKYPYLKRKEVYFNATSYLFSKSEDVVKSDSVLYTYFNNYEEKPVAAECDSAIAYSGKYSEWMDSTKLFSKDIKHLLSEIPEAEVRYAVFTAKVYFDKLPEKAYMNLSFDDSTHSYRFYNCIFSDYCKDGGKWYTMMICGEFPEKFGKGDKVAAFFYNPGGEKFWIDDFKLIVRSSHDPYKK